MHCGLGRTCSSFCGSGRRSTCCSFSDACTSHRNVSVRGKVRPKPQCGWVLFPTEPQLKLACSAYTQYRIDCTCRRERWFIFQTPKAAFTDLIVRQRATRAPCRALNRVGVHEEFLPPRTPRTALRTAGQLTVSYHMPGMWLQVRKCAHPKGKQKTMSFNDVWDCLRLPSTSGRLTFFCANRANSKHAQPAFRKTSEEEQLIVRDESQKMKAI